MSICRMFCRLAAVAALSSTGVAIADAADLSSHVVTQPTLAAPVVSWTGVYIGGAAGVDIQSHSFATSQLASGFDVNYGTATASLNDARARLGGYLGYNYQIHNFLVVGIEGDGAYDFGHTKSVSGIPGETYANVISTDSFSAGKSTYDASARGRAGFTMFDTALFYATGGVAFRDESLTATCAGGANSFCARPLSQTYSGTRTGVTVGGGVEGMITPNLIARVEYRYSDFSSRGLNYFGSLNGPSGDFFSGRAQLSASTVYAGLAYKFNVLQPAAPVVARY